MSNVAEPLRVVIVDDEPLARRRLRDLLADVDRVSLVAECRNGTSVIDAVTATHPDVVLLDVQMPGRDGIGVAELLRELGDDGPVFIFVTGHAEHAVRAFDVRAADYLLKPYSAERLATALARARELLRARQADRLAVLRTTVREELRGLLGADGPPPAASYVERFAVTVGRRTVFVRAESIDRVMSEGNYVRLCVGRESYLLRAAMQEMEQQLDPRQFARVHRTAIVRIDRVREMRTAAHAGDTMVMMLDGTEVPVSARYRRRLERMA
jgi:two-component system, LytTR family, response regulator